MKCEEFEAIGLDAGLDNTLSPAELAAARAHAATCPRCAALQDSWQAARFELHALAEETAAVEIPARVEMRLRQEFRTQHHTLKMRRTAVIAAWALAAAAVLVGAVGWLNWKKSQQEIARHVAQPPAAVAKNETLAPKESTAPQNEATELLVADNGAGDFTLLPGVTPADTDDAAIVRVRMQRGALSALGLPVNEDRAGEWIQVDLLVGDDGLPQAVRQVE